MFGFISYLLVVTGFIEDSVALGDVSGQSNLLALCHSEEFLTSVLPNIDGKRC